MSPRGFALPRCREPALCPSAARKALLALKDLALLCKRCPLCSPFPTSIPPPGEVQGVGVDEASPPPGVPTDGEDPDIIPRSRCCRGCTAISASPGCVVAGWDPSCSNLVSLSSGVSHPTWGGKGAALAPSSAMAQNWDFSGLFPSSPPHMGPCRLSEFRNFPDAAVSRVVSLRELLWRLFHTNLAARTPRTTPHELVKRWTKLSKLREGWGFGASNIFKSYSESRQGQVCL